MTKIRFGLRLVIQIDGPVPAGLGQAAVTAGLGSDLPLLLGITVITAAIVFGGNLIADLLYGVGDPKIRKGAAKT